MSITASLPRIGRISRNPQHSWNVKAKPFVIQPVMIAPVLPGETLKNALFQARVITDPIKSPIIGWWHEYYFFYCKHRDLAGSEDFQEMMLDLNKSMTAQQVGTANTNLYNKAGQIDYTTQCLDAVVAEYFRYESDATATIDGMPCAGINQNSWLDSLMADATLNADDFNVDLDADTNITASEVQKSLMHYEFLKANNMTDMSYEDYLRTYGVSIPKESRNVPELLRYVREWSYPVNTIDPTDGSAVSAVSWAISERMDKDRFFKEPGFIFGVTVTRPKIYLTAQTASAVGLMDDALAWLPAIMRNDAETSLRQLADSTVLTNAVAGNWYDIRDLFIYGDQFTNRLAENINGVALPDASLQTRFPTAAMVEALFNTAGSEYVRQDGICRLSILGTQMDTTPRGSPSGTGIL